MGTALEFITTEELAEELCKRSDYLLLSVKLKIKNEVNTVIFAREGRSLAEVAQALFLLIRDTKDIIREHGEE